MAGVLASNVARAAMSPHPQADEVLNFSLLDYQGKCHELRRIDARFVVLFFTGSDCPIARQLGPKLQQISDEFSAKSVAVLLINATPQNDPSDKMLDAMFAMSGLAPKSVLGDRTPVSALRGLVPLSMIGDLDTIRRETLQYVWGPPPLPPVLKDEHQLVSRYFGITRTCEAVVIDTKSSTIAYRGAVDDQFSEGAGKPAASQFFLRDALNDLVAGRPVANPMTRAHGCVISYRGPRSENISYARDVAPILQNKCIACHSVGNIGPFAMTSYEKVTGWADMIHEVLLDRRMPPWHADPHYGKFVNDRTLTTAESQTLTQWITAGCPRGEGADPLLAVAANYPSTAPSEMPWALGQPDYLVKAPAQDVPATGLVDYRYVDSDFVAPQDMWLRAAVTHPGVTKVVHHIIVRMRRPAGYTGPASESYLFTTWVPGLGEGELPADTGLFVPKGARFNFEIHYTTDGQPHTDESVVGLYVAKQTPKMSFEVRAAQTRELDIPPGVASANHTALYYFSKDSIVYALAPHMHLRGSWFKFQLIEPDGHHEVMLSVPNYDFNWQTSYRLAVPKRVPAGSWMVCTGGFDNSPLNPANPDPTKRVTWGIQTNNEMFMGFIDLAEVPPEARTDVKSPTAQAGNAAAAPQ
jgi:hypothetical protein